MADNILNKGILLHGIGRGVLKTVSSKVLEMSTAQTMKMDITATTEDVYGGDGLFPLYTYISKKEGTVEIDMAEFSLAQLSIAQGVTVTNTGNKQSYHTFITKASTALVDGKTFTGVSVFAVVAPDGSNVEVATTASANALSVTDAGVVAFGTGFVAQDGEYSVYFEADSATTTAAAMLKNAMPEVAAFHWQFTTESSDGTSYQIDLIARRVRCDGKFSIETARDKATVPKLTVKILDPGDGYDDFAVVRVTKMAA